MRPTPSRAVLLLIAVHVALAVALGACAAIVGVKDGIPESDAGTDGTTGDAFADGGPDRAAVPEGSTGDSAAPEASADATVDAFDGGGPEEGGSEASSDGDADSGGCTGQVVDTASGVFVVPGGSDAGAMCGTVAEPCASVQVGLDRANALAAKIVYVAAGTYTESLTLYPGITVEGGWKASGGTWTPICTGTQQQDVTIAAPANAAVTVSANALGGTATLSTLTINSKAQAAVQPGESIYGIMAIGATTALVLDDVAVEVSGGGAGAGGMPGSAASGATGTCSSGLGGNGNPGAAGIGSDGGVFSSAGFAAGGGTTGAQGATGGNGTGGGSGVCALCVTPECSGGSCVVATQTMKCGQNGLSGCGGPGGGPGTGAGGGGSSIVLYVWDAKVTCTGTLLAAGSGGQGGTGGATADGGAGSPGQAGAGMGSCGTTVPSGFLCGIGTACTTSGDVNLNGGTAGGAGGAGGPGGQGGGGAGGWSCSYYLGGAGTVTPSGSTFTHSTAGAGGAVGGANGLANEKCP